MPECKVIFMNSTPCDWDVRIIEIGAKFFYQDEQGKIIREWQTTRGANLDCGQQDALYSDDPSGCVAGIYAGATVYVPNEGNKTFTQTINGGPKHCITQGSFVLAPSGGVSVSDELSKVLRGRQIALVSETTFNEEVSSNLTKANSTSNPSKK